MDNMENIKDKISQNIRYFREKNKMTQKQLAERLGVKHNAVSSWENGTNSVGIEVLFRMCKIFGITINEMYGIEPEISNLKVEEYQLIKKYRQLSESGKKSIDNTIDNLLLYEQHLKEELEESFKEQSAVRETIRIYHSKAAAGIPLPIISDDFDMADKDENIPGDADFGIILSGDSMEPEYPNGCVVWVKSQPSLEEGDIGVFILNNESVCKKLHYNKNGECELVSLNKKYEPIRINEYADLRTVGKVIGHSKKES